MNLKYFSAAALAAAITSTGAALTVVVDPSAPEVAGSSYQKLSTAMDYVNTNGTTVTPNLVNIVSDSIPLDQEVLVTVPVTIEGDGNNNGVKCDILADVNKIQTVVTSKGQPERCFIEVQASSGTVTLNNLKIHPNADNAVNSVDGIRLYRPVNVGETGDYVLNNVWISGSNAADQYISLETANDLYNQAGVKRWSISPGTGGNTGNAVIQVTNAGGSGSYKASLNNCHVGLGKQSAVNIPSNGGTTVTGGLFGHSLRDGIRCSGNGITLTGSFTNRIRVLRVPNESGRDAHCVEVEGANKVLKMEYVDVAPMSSGNGFKFFGTSANGGVNLMRYCRALGKLDNLNNAMFFIAENCKADNIRNCTFVGSGNNYNPLETAGGYTNVAKFYDCIFASDNLGFLKIDNTLTTNPRFLTNCAIPTDLYTSESLNAATPVRNTSTGQSANLPTMANIVTASPHFIKRLADYDWTENAVSVDGSNPLAGNPDVLKPAVSFAYRNAASDGSDLTGGAGGSFPPIGSTAARDWSHYE
jgi:hypothetical protein